MSAVRTKQNLFNSTANRERGAATIELAFVIFVLLLMIAGTVAFGRAFWYADALTKSTRDGARILTTWPAASINSAGLDKAKTMTIAVANAAGVSPALLLGDVVAECMSATFTVVACVDGSKPENVRVRITGFSLSLAEWFPFIASDGSSNYGEITFLPHTTMRYMN